MWFDTVGIRGGGVRCMPALRLWAKEAERRAEAVAASRGGQRPQAARLPALRSDDPRAPPQATKEHGRNDMECRV